jgi:hypothetical protein
LTSGQFEADNGSTGSPETLVAMSESWNLPETEEPPPPADSVEPPPSESWPSFTLAELADQEAMGYRAWGNPAGEMFARHMDELALKIRMTDATTPEEYEGRIEVLDDGIREQWENRGYEAGLQAARNQCRCGTAMHD